MPGMEHEKVMERLKEATEGTRPKAVEAVHLTTPVLPPAEPKATNPSAPTTEEAPKGDGGQVRDDKGRFAAKDQTPDAEKPKSDIVQMRELLKAMKAEKRALAERVEALERERKASPETPTADPTAELVKAMPEETRNWWNQFGEKLVDMKAEKKARAFMEPYSAALEQAKAAATRESDRNRFEMTFNDWCADKMLDGEVVDRAAVIDGLTAIEEKGITFSDVRRGLDLALAMVKAKGAPASIPVVTAEEARKRKEAEAAEKARAGGVSPAQAYTPPPVDTRANLAAELRKAGWTGDQDAQMRILYDRLKGVIPFPSDAPKET